MSPLITQQKAHLSGDETLWKSGRKKRAKGSEAAVLSFGITMVVKCESYECVKQTWILMSHCYHLCCGVTVRQCCVIAELTDAQTVKIS